MEKFSIYDSFKCQEDLFYTIYDYLRFTKPVKWNFIHSLDDFNFMLPDEVRDLANDACDWLENDLINKINIWDKDAGAPCEWSTLYYMTLAYINTYNGSERAKIPSLYEMDLNELKVWCSNTILWLRNFIENIK